MIFKRLHFYYVMNLSQIFINFDGILSLGKFNNPEVFVRDQSGGLAFQKRQATHAKDNYDEA